MRSWTLCTLGPFLCFFALFLRWCVGEVLQGRTIDFVGVEMGNRGQRVCGLSLAHAIRGLNGGVLLDPWFFTCNSCWTPEHDFKCEFKFKFRLQRRVFCLQRAPYIVATTSLCLCQLRRAYEAPQSLQTPFFLKKKKKKSWIPKNVVRI